LCLRIFRLFTESRRQSGKEFKVPRTRLQYHT
jgi:hypothetical protein